MTLRIGLIGLGSFAQHTVVPAIEMAPDLELAAIYDLVPAAINEVAGRLPESSVAASASELIQRRDLDLIYVATPPKSHKELVEAVIAARRPVVSEKPFSMNYADAAYLADLARKAGLVNAVDHEMRYSSIYTGMRDRIASGYVGSPVFASATFASDFAVNPLYRPTYYWNFGSLRSECGGLLRQHMSHFIDLYLYMLGGIEPAGGHCGTMIKAKPELVETVSATGERVFSAGPLRPVDADDAVALAGHLPNGAPASITATWSSPVRTGTRWLIQGDQGVLLYQSGDEITGLWGGEVHGAQAGQDMSRIALPPERLPEANQMGARYMATLVAAELLDVAHSIDTGADGSFATFDSECQVWRAIESWSN